MSKRAKNPPTLTEALDKAGKRIGWHSQPKVVQVFQVGECRVAVVPFVMFAYRRRDKIAAEWHRQQLEREAL